MKITTKLIPIVCILVTTVLSIIFLELKDSEKYLVFNDYNREFISLDYNEDVPINIALISRIFEIAENNHVILLKNNASNQNNKSRNIYLSFNSISQLYDFMTKKFQVKKTNKIVENNNDMFISTYYHNDKNQIGFISDLLENSRYNYYTFQKLLDDNGNLYGEYIVYYKNYQDFSQFSTQVKTVVGQEINSYSRFSNSDKYIIIILIISVIILMIFYFIFQIYDTYYKAKYISCMRLLGFSSNKIVQIMFKKKLKLYSIIITIILLLSLILIKNITAYQLLFLLFINSFLILFTYYINYQCVSIISGSYQVTNILKKQNIAVKISKTSGKIKIIIICLLIISSTFFVQSMRSLFDSLKIYNQSKELLGYGIIKDFSADTSEIFDYGNQVQLYSDIVNDKRLSTIYAHFGYFGEKTEEEKKMGQEMEEAGTYFSYASVDKNYLKKEEIKLYDLNNKLVNIENLEGVYFLFPKSKIDKIDKFKNFYINDSVGAYAKYNVSHDFVAYLYDDQKLNSYRLNLNIKYVDSPIVRVIDDSIRVSYLETPIGLSLFGNSLTTGLKIKLVNNKNQTFKIIEEHIKENDLQNLISINNFMTFQEYFSNEINIATTMTAILILAIGIILSIYIIISLQVASLYVKSEQQKVIIKYLLGFEKEDIFRSIINHNRIENMTAFVLTLLFLILIRQLNIVLFLISVSVFIITDFIVLFLIIKFYRFSKIYEQLKGGNYD